MSSKLKSHLREASRHAVKVAVEDLKKHLIKQRWIEPGNIYVKNYKYKKGVQGAMRMQDSLQRGKMKKRQLKDYVAASIFNHCSDGWSLLARALQCHVKGDQNAAVHLAYYAELRAAMAILASEGVGVFNSKHVVISDSEVKPTISVPTHELVWTALEHWTERKLSAELLVDLISPYSIPLREWFDAFELSFHSIGQHWLKTWGIDIKQFSDDHILRNYSSYRPSRIISRKHLPAEQAVSFLKELWRLCEPTPSSRFEEIDKHLLRMSLAQAYKSTRGLDPKSDVSKYRDWVESKIAKLSLDPAIRKTWVDFLTWKIQPDDPSLLKQAAEVTSLENPDHHIQVIARAALLLRIATGIAGRLLAEAGFTKDQLIFWLEPYAVDHGVLENGGAVSDFLDLWADTEAALRDVSDWESSVTPSYSYGDLVRNIPSQIHRLGESERVFLWGLGI